MDSGQEQNYWPGFVDALSNVVLTLIFVLVIFVFALVMASNKVEQRMQQVVEAENAHKAGAAARAETQQQLEQKIQELQIKLDQASEELKKFQAPGSGVSQSERPDIGVLSHNVANEVSKSKEIVVQSVAQADQQAAVNIVKQDQDKVSLYFPPSVSEIDKASADSLDKALGEAQQKSSAKRILIKSIMGKEAYSAAQRLAYYRALAVRNILITQRGISPDLISSTIVNADNQEDGRVEIYFIKE